MSARLDQDRMTLRTAFDLKSLALIPAPKEMLTDVYWKKFSKHCEVTAAYQLLRA
jgi:hypothetical protein